MSVTKTEIIQFIRKKMIAEVKSRANDCVLPENFVDNQMSNINEAAAHMYSDYKRDNELDDLQNAENDWFREYLYEYVDTSGLRDR